MKIVWRLAVGLGCRKHEGMLTRRPRRKVRLIVACSDLAIALMMEAARTSETSVDNYFTRQYIPEDKSELHTRRRENLKSHIIVAYLGLKTLSIFSDS
jgi:hypothetical protein